MTRTVYQRVQADALPDSAPPAAAIGQVGPRPALGAGVRWFVLPLSALLCTAQAVITISASNTQGVQITSTLIAVLAMGALFAAVLLFNPLLRLIYLGNLLPARAAAAGRGVMSWSGLLTLAAALALPAVIGPGFMRAILAGVLAAAAGAAAVDLALGMTATPRRRLSRAGRGAIGWAVALVGMFALMSLCPAGWAVPLPWGPTPAAVAALLLCLVIYIAAWIFFSRGLNRAELTTIAAALIVTSGVSTFGLCEQLVPLIPTPYNAMWNTPESGWDTQVIPNIQKKLYITDPKVISDFRVGLRRTADNQEIKLPDPRTGTAGAWVSFYWTVAVNLPWRQWVGPLGYWMIFVLGCYALFYSLTYTVLGHWSSREKIIFPLAKLPESLLPDERHAGWLPPIFRTTAFWAGLLLASVVLTYNGSVRVGWLGGMGVLPLGMGTNSFTAHVQGTIVEGLGGGTRAMRFPIIFTAIGIAFLLPLEISFSMWFYYLVGRAILLMLVWTGHGRDMRDFPDDWLWSQNAVSAQGLGGILVFSAIILYRTMRDTLAQVASRGEAGRRRLLALLPPLGLVASILVVSAWVWWNWDWNGRYVGWALIFVLFLTLLSLGLMRTTAEGGVYWYQANGSFFHIWKSLGLGSFLPGALVAPLLPIYSVLFLDVKAFMAPNLANAGKMQEDAVPTGRARFHLNMALNIAVSIVVSIGFALVMAYARGANRMQSWFYSHGPQGMMDTASQAAVSVPKFDAVSTSWMGLGAIWVIVTVFLRRSFFWFPHPIGYVMMINPLMDEMWFSFFVGWVCKKLVVQYGGKNTFDKVKNFFIGLIIGEIITICAWMVISLLYTLPPTFITLNRAD